MAAPVYETGTISIANGASVAVGTGTFWSPLSSNSNILFIPSANLVRYIDSVTDDTHLALSTYSGTAIVNAAYQLLQLPSGSTQAAKDIRDHLARLARAGVWHYVAVGGTPDDAYGDDGDFALRPIPAPATWWTKISGHYVFQGTLGTATLDIGSLGAPCDGVEHDDDTNSGNATGTDSFSYFVSAIAQLSAAGGGTLYVPYYGTGKFLWKKQSGANPTLVLPSNVFIRGEGARILFEATPNGVNGYTNGILINSDQVGGNTNVNVVGLTFKPAGPYHGSVVIAFKKVTGGKIQIRVLDNNASARCQFAQCSGMDRDIDTDYEDGPWTKQLQNLQSFVITNAVSAIGTYAGKVKLTVTTTPDLATDHFAAGQNIEVISVVGTTEAIGTHPILDVGSNYVTIDVPFVHAYVSGGRIGNKYGYEDGVRDGSGSHDNSLRGNIHSGDDAVTWSNELSETGGSTTGADIYNNTVDVKATTRRGNALRAFHSRTMIAGIIRDNTILSLTGKPNNIGGTGVSLYDTSGRRAIVGNKLNNVNLDWSGITGTSAIELINTDDTVFNGLNAAVGTTYGLNANDAHRTQLNYSRITGAIADNAAFFNGSTGSGIEGGYLASAGRDNVHVEGTDDFQIGRARLEAPGRSNIRGVNAQRAIILPNRHVSSSTDPVIKEESGSDFWEVYRQKAEGVTTGVDTSSAGTSSHYYETPYADSGGNVVNRPSGGTSKSWDLQTSLVRVGQLNTVTGAIRVFGGTSGYGTATAQAAMGTAAWLWPTNNGTFVVSATSPLAVDAATGNMSLSVVSGALGGTGVANTGKTITLGGNLVTSGAYAVTFTLTGATNITLPTSGTVATIADVNAAVIGLLDDRGNWDASGNLFPSGTGSGTAGAVLKGDLWTISVAGTLGSSAVTAGDVVRALVDTPGQTAGNWTITENNFGYVAENSANKDTDGTLAANSDTKYASQKATKTYADTKVPKAISGLTAAAAVADADLFPTDQTAGALKQTFTAVKTWIKAWIVKGDVGLGSVDNTADSVKIVASAAILTTSRNIDGQAFNGSAAITVIAPGTHAATGKTTPVDADELPIVDSAASNVLKKLTWANLKATIKAYYDPVASTLTNKDLTSGTNTFPTFNQSTTGSAATLTTARNIDGQAFDGSAAITVIAPGTHAATSKATPVDADEVPLVDSAASNVLKKLTWANLKVTIKTYYDGVASTVSNKLFDATCTATTATQGTNTTTLATTAYVDRLAGTVGAIPCRNIIVNPGFTVNQRSYASAATLAATARGHDCWKAGSGGGNYSFTQLASNTTITIAANKTLIQVVEDKAVVGGTYVLSWTGTAQARYAINSATPAGSYASSPITITGQTAGTTMSIEFGNGASTGTLGNVQLELGTQPTPIEVRPHALEVILCRRFLQVLGGAAYAFMGQGTADNTTDFFFQTTLTPTMRTGPTPTFSGQTDFAVKSAGLFPATTAMANSVSQPEMIVMKATVASGLTAGFGGYIQDGGTGNGRIYLSAEL
jgi:hypothetical protein